MAIDHSIPKSKLWGYVEDFISLIYPKLCLSCRNNLPYGEQVLCLSCQHQLPRTDHHLVHDNAFIQKFWGRIPIQAGAACYYFDQKGKVQQLIHQLKYKNQPMIAHKIGQLYGRTLQESLFFKEIDSIIPVPLHPRKKHLRGYNQSERFAQGLSLTMKIPWNGNTLLRNQFTPTQTTKSREDRFSNVEKAFSLQTGEKLAGKHVLLVDDVLTTGATLEACALKLLSVKDLKVSLATIAIANQ